LDRLRYLKIWPASQPGSRFLCHTLCMPSMTRAQRTGDSCRCCHHNTPYHCEFHSNAKAPHVFLRQYAFGIRTIFRRALLVTHPVVLIKSIISYLKFMGPCGMVNILKYIYIYIYIQKTQLYTVYLYLETALHISGGTSTQHQERIQLYLQYLVFVTPLL